MIHTVHLVQYNLHTLYNTHGTLVRYTLHTLYNTHLTTCTTKVFLVFLTKFSECDVITAGREAGLTQFSLERTVFIDRHRWAGGSRGRVGAGGGRSWEGQGMGKSAGKEGVKE